MSNTRRANEHGRGIRWERAIVTSPGWFRRVATAMIGAGLLAPLAAGPVFATDLPPAPPPVVSAKSMEASLAAQKIALTQRQVLEMQRLTAYWADQLAMHDQAVAADTSAQNALLLTVGTPARVERDAAMADIAARRSAINVVAVYAAKRASTQAWLDGYAAQLKKFGKPLKYEEALIVRAQVKAQRDAEMKALEAQQKIELAPFEKVVNDLKTSRAAGRNELVTAQAGALTQLGADQSQSLADRTAQTDAACGRFGRLSLRRCRRR